MNTCLFFRKIHIVFKSNQICPHCTGIVVALFSWWVFDVKSHNQEMVIILHVRTWVKYVSLWQSNSSICHMCSFHTASWATLMHPSILLYIVLGNAPSHSNLKSNKWNSNSSSKLAKAYMGQLIWGRWTSLGWLVDW